MTVIRGYDLWLCNRCGKTETHRSDEYGEGYEQSYYPDGWWGEDLCEACYHELYPPRPVDQNDPMVRLWHPELQAAIAVSNVLSDLVESKRSMAYGDVIHIPDRSNLEVR